MIIAFFLLERPELDFSVLKTSLEIINDVCKIAVFFWISKLLVLMIPPHRIFTRTCHYVSKKIFCAGVINWKAWCSKQPNFQMLLIKAQIWMLRYFEKVLWTSLPTIIILYTKILLQLAFLVIHNKKQTQVEAEKVQGFQNCAVWG